MEELASTLRKMPGRAPSKHEPAASSNPAVDLSASSSGHSGHSHNPSSVRGRADYGQLLWGADHTRSGTLDYVRTHANRMVQRVDAEDPRVHFAVHKHVQDVRVYKRASASASASTSAFADALSSTPGPASAGFSPSSSFSSARSSRIRAPSTSADGAADEDLSGHMEFRGMTRVPGTVDTIVAALAPERPRDAYWLAANTLKNLRFTTITRADRVAAASEERPQRPQGRPQPQASAFPRWSLQYLMAKFIKHSRTMDVAFAEFAAVDPPASSTSNPSSSSRRRGFIYRRSVDDRALGDAELQRKLAAVAASGSDASVAARAHERVHRFLLRDWLLDVRETDEPNVCKLVLTVRAIFRADDDVLRRSMRLECREWCTNYLVGLRKVLVTQWTDLVAERAATTRVSSRMSLRSLPSEAQPSAAAKICSVCSAPFSLLRKRHSCRTCGSSTCAKCSAVKVPTGASVSNAGLLGNENAANSRRKRECVLCAQFGPPVTRRRSAVRASVRRAFDESMASTVTYSVSSLQVDEEDEEDDNADDVAAPALSSRGGSVLVGPATLARTSSREKVDESAGRSSSASTASSPAPSVSSRLNKFRTDSNDSTSSARSAPGIVLISDIEQLSLAGSFRRIPSGSGSSSNFASSLGPRGSVARAKRPDRAVSEDNVLASIGYPQPHHPEDRRPSAHTMTSMAPSTSITSDEDDDEEVTEYSEDDLANFTLELAP